MPPAEATRRFKMPANTKLASVKSIQIPAFKFLQEKHVKPLLRYGMHGFQQSQVKLSDESEDVVRPNAENAQSVVRVQS